MNELQSVLSVSVKIFVLEITFEDGKAFALDFKPIESEAGWLFDPLRDPWHQWVYSYTAGRWNGPTVWIFARMVGLRCMVRARSIP